MDRADQDSTNRRYVGSTRLLQERCLALLSVPESLKWVRDIGIYLGITIGNQEGSQKGGQWRTLFESNMTRVKPATILIRIIKSAPLSEPEIYSERSSLISTLAGAFTLHNEGPSGSAVKGVHNMRLIRERHGRESSWRSV